jgi:hypothetical protein
VSTLPPRPSEDIVELMWSIALGQHVCISGAERDLLFDGEQLREPVDAVAARLSGEPFALPTSCAGRLRARLRDRRRTASPTTSRTGRSSGWRGHRATRR